MENTFHQGELLVTTGRKAAGLIYNIR